MRFYGLSATETLGLPIKTFWLLDSNIPRVRAEEDLRAMRIQAGTQNPKGYEELANNLAKEIGTVVVADATRDEEGFARLKRMQKV